MEAVSEDEETATIFEATGTGNVPTAATILVFHIHCVFRIVNLISSLKDQQSIVVGEHGPLQNCALIEVGSITCRVKVSESTLLVKGYHLSAYSSG